MRNIKKQEVINPKTNKFSKAAFLNKIVKGEILVYEKNDNVDNNYYLTDDIEILIKLKSGLHFNANYNNRAEDLQAYLGTSYYYKFAFKN